MPETTHKSHTPSASNIPMACLVSPQELPYMSLSEPTVFFPQTLLGEVMSLNCLGHYWVGSVMSRSATLIHPLLPSRLRLNDTCLIVLYNLCVQSRHVVVVIKLLVTSAVYRHSDGGIHC